MGWWTDRVVPRLADGALKGREIGELRGRACAGLAGRVLEPGFGGGLNLRWLPPEVTSVDAIEPSDLGWELSRRRRERLAVPVERVGLDGARIEAEDASYDAVLVTFTLCTIPDVKAALDQMRRVLRPGGSLHFLEHGRSESPGVARWQHRLEPVQRRLAGGCHLTRDPGALLADAGFALVSLQRPDLPGCSLSRPWTAGYLGLAVTDK
jgi:SAM-dependent methyltransferase